jgi:hypothetical protein
LSDIFSSVFTIFVRLTTHVHWPSF